MLNTVADVVIATLKTSACAAYAGPCEWAVEDSNLQPWD